MRRLLLLVSLCSACAAEAAITNVKVIGSTNVQSLISYQAPDNHACSVQISEQPSLQPLVKDVDPSVFPGSDSDARSDSLTDGQNRVFVAGSRAVDRGGDGKWYSHALQTDTLHYFLIRCGSDTAAGSFRTANIPVGSTYPWAFPQHPDTGHFRWPSTDGNDRSQAFIDPNYGTLIRRVSVPGDAQADIDAVNRVFAAAAGANWSNPAAALADDGLAAQYAGTGQDWLVLKQLDSTGFSDFYVGALGVNRIAVHVKGWAQGASALARSIDLCLTTDGVNCAGAIRTMALEPGSSLKTVGGDTVPDNWGIEAINTRDMMRNAQFGVMVRPTTAGTAVSIDSVTMDAKFAPMMTMPEGGFMQVCAATKSNGGFHCAFRSTLGIMHLYWIQPASGEVRFLGRIVAGGWGGNDSTCGNSNFATFDSQDPNTYYCSAGLNGRSVLLKGTYAGGDTAAAPDAIASFQWVNLTPSGTTVSDLIQQFDPSYDPNLFPLTLDFITSQYAVYQGAREGQDSTTWLALLDLGNKQPLGAGGTARIVAATQAWAAPNSRWCGTHTTEYVGPRNWIGWDAIPLMGGGTPGSGPFKVVLQSSIPAGTGQFTITVSGEPQPYIMPTQPGDLFVFRGSDGTDFVRIVQKLSPTQWVVQRDVYQGAAVTARDPGQEIVAFCNARQASIPYQGAYVYWDFLNDPHAQDSTGTRWVVERILTGGHISQRGNYRIMESSDGYSVVTPGLPQSFNQPRSWRVVGNPLWAGKRASNIGQGLGVAYQQHLSFENWAATDPGRNNWFVDMIPFVGGLHNSLTAAPGLSQVYKVQATVQRDAFPTFAVCGGRQLKDISPGPISDGQAYTYCVGSQCAAGAGGGDVFINCPPPVTAQSTCPQPPDASGVCAGDMSPYGQAITQFFLDSAGTHNRVLTNALYAWQSSRTFTYFDTAYALPDGSWIVFASYGNNGHKGLYMVKVPNQPVFDSDPRAGSEPVNATISLTAPGSATGVKVQAVGGESLSQACNGNCTLLVPLRPMELLATVPVFVNGSGQPLGTGGIQAQILTGILGAGIANPKLAAINPVLNAFSFQPQLAPGAMVSVFGTDLADCESSAGSLPLPTAICNASLAVNGTPVPLFYAGPNQINAQLPFSLPAQQPFNVYVGRAGNNTDTTQIDASLVGAVAPAIAAYTLDGVVTRAAMQNSDGSTNGPGQPLHLGQNAVLYVNALGPTTPPVQEGQAAPQQPPAATVNPVEVYVNGIRQQVSFSGLTPTLAGVYQLNFTLDPSTPIQGGNNDWVLVRVSGVSSPQVTITIAK